MPVKINDNTAKVFRNIAEDKVKPFIAGVGSIGATLSMNYAPLEFGPLRASQEFTTGMSGKTYWAKVSFGKGIDSPYPYILENKENWSPRSPDKKAGPAWNPMARPHYLREGFEGSEAQSEIESLKKVLKV